MAPRLRWVTALLFATCFRGEKQNRRTADVHHLPPVLGENDHGTVTPLEVDPPGGDGATENAGDPFLGSVAGADVAPTAALCCVERGVR